MNIPKHIKAVIFDMDGLLIDSEVYWDEADRQLLEKRGFIPTHELFLRRLGTGHLPTLQIYKDEFGIDEELESLSKDRLDIFYEILWKNLQLMDGAHNLIVSLQKNNIPMAIATGGHNPENLNEILKRLTIDPHFSALVTLSHVKRAKPHPDIFLYAANELKVDPENCLVFEDAPSGVKAAKAGNMYAIGINKNPTAQKALHEAGADAVFTSLGEVSL